MTLSRRSMLGIGGAVLAAPLLGGTGARGADILDVAMRGNAEGSEVRFEPFGLLLRPGQTVRWTNKDAGNAHTTTAYHPDNDGHPLRIPAKAAPWNSDYLLPEESFSLMLTVPGVYDYFCVPHEHAGMVGRLVVMAPGQPPPEAPGGSPLKGAASDPFPPVSGIIRSGRVSKPAAI